MIKSNENINFILCYISNGFNEKIELNNCLNKTNENEENKIILEKIISSKEIVLKLEKFKKTSNKLNEMLKKLDKIKNNFMKNNSDNMTRILESFKTIILNKDLDINQNFDKILKKYNIKINTIEENKNSIENKFIVLYFQNNFIIKDVLIEILNNMKIKFITINLDKNDDSTNKISNLKKNHKYDNIYLFIINYFIINEKKVTNFINDLIEKLNIK